MRNLQLLMASALGLALAQLITVGSGAAPLPGSSQNQDEPIRLKSDLVSLSVTVTDSEGHTIKALKPGDFAVFEDGVKQKIEHFAASEEPFSLMLLLDVSGSTHDEIDLMKRAAKNFLGEIRWDDRVALIVFSREVELIADFTDGRAKLATEIGQIATPEGAPDHRFTLNTGTSFYDALYLAVDESPLKTIEGRKAIVCMSDGVDSTSKLKYSDISKLVEKSGASVYFLELNTEEETLEGLLKNPDDPGHVSFSGTQLSRYYDEFDPGSVDRSRPSASISPLMRREINSGLYRIARRELRELAERAGGRVYPVKTLTDLAGVYAQVASDLRSQYSIGYYSAGGKHDGTWRAIRVQVRRPEAVVRTRSGYWAPGK